MVGVPIALAAGVSGRMRQQRGLLLFGLIAAVSSGTVSGAALRSGAVLSREAGDAAPAPASGVVVVDVDALKRTASCFYVVRSGDSLSGVAEHFGIPVPLLQTYNSWVGVLTKFEEGMTLRVPAVREDLESRCADATVAQEAEAERTQAAAAAERAIDRTIGEELARAQQLRAELDRQLARHELATSAHSQNLCDECRKAHEAIEETMRLARVEAHRQEEGDRAERKSDKAFAKIADERMSASLGQPTCQYTVRAGQTYGTICEIFAIPAHLLRTTNELSEASSNWNAVARVGRVLTIPVPKAESRQYCDASAEVCPYVVKQGDSLGFIADKFGSSRAHVALVNGLPSTEFSYFPALRQRLLIPNPSKDGAQHCVEASQTMVVPIVGLADHAEESDVEHLEVLRTEPRAERTAAVAAEAAERASDARSKMERITSEAKAARESRNELAKKVAEQQDKVQTGRDEFKAAVASGDREAMRKAAQELKGLEKRFGELSAELGDIEAEADKLAADARDATAEYEKLQEKAKGHEQVANAHSSLHASHKWQSEREPLDTGSKDLSFAEPAAKETDTQEAEQQLRALGAELMRFRTREVVIEDAKAAEKTADAAEAAMRDPVDLDAALRDLVADEVRDLPKESAADHEAQLAAARARAQEAEHAAQVAEEKLAEAQRAAAAAAEAEEAAERAAAHLKGENVELTEAEKEQRERVQKAREDLEELRARLDSKQQALEELRAQYEDSEREGTEHEQQAKSMEKELEELRALANRGSSHAEEELEKEVKRRVMLEGRVVRLTRALEDVQAARTRSNKMAEQYETELATLRRRLETISEQQHRAEQDVAGAVSRADSADRKEARELVAEHRAHARKDAQSLHTSGTSVEDPCVRATQAQAQAHSLSLRVRVANATIHRRRDRLEVLQDEIESRDRQMADVEGAMEKLTRELKREVALRACQAEEFHRVHAEHTLTADAVRTIRGLLMSSRVGMYDGEVGAIVSKEAHAAAAKAREQAAISAVIEKVRAGELPTAWLDADGSLIPEVLAKTVETANEPPLVVGGRAVIGYGDDGSPLFEGEGAQTPVAFIERSASLSPKCLNAHAAFLEVAAMVASKDEEAAAPALLETQASRRSRSQPSHVRRLRNVLANLRTSITSSKSAFTQHEKAMHHLYRLVHQKIEPRLHELRATRRLLTRERARLQAQRAAVQEDLQHQVVEMETAHREYTAVSRRVMVALEKCMSSAHGLHPRQ